MKFTLDNLSPEELSLIGEGLGELKFGRVAALVNKLNQQIADQQTPKQPEPNDPEAN